MGRINVRVIAQDVMLHGCLETVRNPAISVIQRRNERYETIKNKKETFYLFINFKPVKISFVPILYFSIFSVECRLYKI